MEFLVSYDVATDTPSGRRRLRRVAEVCEGHGQRVQKSVFECTLTEITLEQLRWRLLREIDLATDSLRIYRLREPRSKYVEAFGKRPLLDLHDPLIS